MKLLNGIDSRLKFRRKIAIYMVVLSFLLSSEWAFAASENLAAQGDYHRYIDPLLGVTDFHANYSEDGAADGTVVFPVNNQRPPEPVVALIRLRGRSLPLLIDCLGEMRITAMRFEGNRITRPMNVPLGYVCLDILMNEVSGNPVWYPDCADDGLGACVKNLFYFRPDDYYSCTERDCMLRPWVLVVQRKWKSEYLAHRLRFHNPYDSLPVEEYKELKTTHR